MFGLVVRKFEILKLLKFFKSPVGHSIPYSADDFYESAKEHKYTFVCKHESFFFQKEKTTTKFPIN